MFLMGVTATIDTGMMNESWHELVTRQFFVLSILAQIYNVIICSIFSRISLSISVWNLYVKYFVILLFVMQLADGAAVEYFMGRIESDKTKLLEWTMTATVISMFVSIGFDVNQF